MVQNLRPVGADVGSPEQIRSADLNAKTVDQDRWVPLHERQSSKSVKYFPGRGVNNRRGNAGFADMDLQDDSTTPVNIDGQFRWEIYSDANQDDLVATSIVGRSEDLRAAVNENRTEKPMEPLQKPGAGEEGYVVLAFKADAGSDGATVSPSNSSEDVGIPYTRVLD